MKTILIPNYLKEYYVQDSMTRLNQSFLVDQQIEPLEVYLYKDIDCESDLSLSIHASKRMEAIKDELPIYGKMVSFPAFKENVIRFTKQLILYGIDIDSLPTSTASQQDIQRIISSIIDLPFPEYKKREILHTPFSIQDTTYVETFIKDVFTSHVIDEMKKNGLETTSLCQKENPTITVKKALNIRQEIEAVAQEICLQKSASKVNIVLCDYANQFPVLAQIFHQYSIPFSSVTSPVIVHITQAFNSLVDFSLDPSLETFFMALETQAFSLSSSLDTQKTLLRFATSIADLKEPLHFDTSSFLVSSNERKEIDRKIEEANQFLSAIQNDFLLLIKEESIQEKILHCFEVVCRCHWLQYPKETQVLFSIKSILEDVYNLIETKEDVALIQSHIESISVSISSFQKDGCIVTSLTKPVPERDTCYVLGCTASLYPAFSSLNGIFDEEYVSHFKYPSLEERYALYMNSLKWISHSASHITYSTYTNGFDGKGVECSFDMEQLAPKDARNKPIILNWALIQNNPRITTSHTLSPSIAKDLFTKEGEIQGSISKFERYFYCPYSYFIQYGLNVQEERVTELLSNTIGTIQHAILENAIKLYGKNYASLSEEEMRHISSPFFLELYQLYPCDTPIIKLIENKMIHNLLLSFHFLQDMEEHTSFEPYECEYRINDIILEGPTPIRIRGIIDRIDRNLDLIRILDYKSSDHSLKENEIKAGIQLQLLTYMYMIKKLLSKEVAGVYYYSLKNENIPVDASKKTRAKKDSPSVPEPYDESTNEELFLAKHRLKGYSFIPTDGLDYDTKHIVGFSSTGKLPLYDAKAIEECLLSLYTYLEEHLLQGDIPLNPVKGACTFCPYKSICLFKGQERKITPLTQTEGTFKLGGKANDNVE